MRKHFAMLDFLRGVAAFAVVVFHQPAGSLKLFAHGYLAVDFFFLLSGFVIAASYEDRLANGSLGFGVFVRTRFIRLYPLVILGGILGSFQHFGEFAPYVVAGGILLIPTSATGDPSAFATNPPAWSLFWEVAVNIVYGKLSRFLTNGILYALTALGFAAVVACAYEAGTMNYGFSWSQFYGGGARVVFSFFAGILIYRVWLNGWRPTLPWYAVVIGLVALLILPRRLESWYFDSAIVLAFPLLVLVAASCDLPAKCAKLATLMGNVSYPLYILQHGLGVPKKLLDHLQSTGFNMLIISWAWTIAVCVLATAAFYFYDKPVRDWLNKRFRSKPGVAAASAP